MNNVVSNVMGQVKLQQQEPTMWEKFKDFAGSNAGKMVLGGLGTGLAVGLAGGDTKQALAYVQDKKLFSFDKINLCQKTTLLKEAAYNTLGLLFRVEVFPSRCS